VLTIPRCHNRIAARRARDISPTERASMSCKIQASLTEAWSAATEQFSASVKAMTGNHVGTMPGADYKALRASAEDARLKSENARMLLELHRKEHGC
jgi:hypothetical protein